MHRTLKTFLSAIVIIPLLLLAGCNRIDTTQKPEHGILDLKNWNSKESGIILLNGEWDFYWNRLLSYPELRGAATDLEVQVPGAWNNYTLGQEPLPGQGVATYRLKVKSNFPEGTLLAFKIRTVSSAYRLFVNGEQVAGAGTLGLNAKDEKVEYSPQTAVFRVPDKQFDIIIQVSNHYYAQGGLWDGIYLGGVDQIHEYDNMLTGRETFLLGILLIVALFHLAMFLLLRELRYTLYFSLLTLSSAAALGTRGQMILICPFIPSKAMIYLWYSSTGWIAYFLLLFLNELFPSGFSKITIRIYSAFMVLFQAACFFINPLYYTNYAAASNLNKAVVLFLSLLIILFNKKEDYKHWLLNVISVIIVLCAFIHDNLYLILQPQSLAKDFFGFSVAFALALQMITQAQRIKTYFDHKVSAELLLLQAQIKPHFLYNTINTIISVSRTDPEKARNLLIDFSLYLRRRFDLKESKQLVPLSDELEQARAYIAIEKARFGSRLTVEFHVQEYLENVKVPILILQPIIENAIIHGVLPKPEGGRVDVSIQREGQWVSFLVKDDGAGMDIRNPEALLEQKGGSIGLSNIDTRIRRLYKRGLEIKSEVNKGTEVKWYIFVNRSERQNGKCNSDR